MTSVAQKNAVPSRNDDVAHRLNNLMIVAEQGKAICEVMTLEGTCEQLAPEFTQQLFWDLSEKLERISSELDKIWLEV